MVIILSYYLLLIKIIIIYIYYYILLYKEEKSKDIIKIIIIPTTTTTQTEKIILNVNKYKFSSTPHTLFYTYLLVLYKLSRVSIPPIISRHKTARGNVHQYLLWHD